MIIGDSMVTPLSSTTTELAPHLNVMAVFASTLWNAPMNVAGAFAHLAGRVVVALSAAAVRVLALLAFDRLRGLAHALLHEVGHRRAEKVVRGDAAGARALPARARVRRRREPRLDRTQRLGRAT